MRDDLIERREETWHKWMVQGLRTGDVASQLAPKYGVKEATIRKDISRMDDWLEDLAEQTSKSLSSRMREYRKNRQRLQQMAEEARQEGDIHTELKIRRQIEQNIERDVELSQSIGETPKEPDRTELSVESPGLAPENQDHFDELTEKATDSKASTVVGGDTESDDE